MRPGGLVGWVRGWGGGWEGLVGVERVVLDRAGWREGVVGTRKHTRRERSQRHKCPTKAANESNKQLSYTYLLQLP